MPTQLCQSDVSMIREQFAGMYLQHTRGMAGKAVIDKSGVKMLEIHGASFLANADAIFGFPNLDYIEREIAWYEGQVPNIFSMPDGKNGEDIPAIWLKICGDNGEVNSNYGYLVHHAENGLQFENVLNELLRCHESRRAVMIYTRPSMHGEFDTNGMSDFICTNAVQYLIRDGLCHAIVQMRSNDVVFGYRNDLAWQRHVHKQLVDRFNEATEDGYMGSGMASPEKIKVGDIIWQVGSLHVYERHFYLIERYLTAEGDFQDTPTQ